MGAYMVPPTASLDQAHARDRSLAEALMARILKDRRAGHPALAHLKVVLAEKHDLEHRATLAAVAFETAARLRLGEVAGAMAQQGKRHPEVAPFLIDRTPTQWESSSRAAWSPPPPMRSGRAGSTCP